MRYLAYIVIPVVLCVSTTAAEENKPINDFHSKIIHNNKNAGETPSSEILASQNPHVKPYAAIVQASLWQAATIPVCWENPSVKYANEMDWVSDAVRRTWETASALKFTGWKACAAINNGIRIQIADAGPHVKSLGRGLDRMKNGMVLNFTFGNWGQSCQSKKEDCIRAIAVHEFGHAIGFTHEQNRADAPGECRLLAQGTDPDAALTPYDPASVMNYCNKKWNNDGFLSTMDVEAVRILYGMP